MSTSPASLASASGFSAFVAPAASAATASHSADSHLPIDLKFGLRDALAQTVPAAYLDSAVEASLRVAEQRLFEVDIAYHQAQRDVDFLRLLVERMEQQIRVIEGALAWRIGSKIVRMMKRLMRRTEGPTVFDDIAKLYAGYMHWKVSR